MKKRILVIDDDPDLLESLKDILTLEHFRVLAAGDSTTGLDIARQSKPDLILSDIKMNHKDGFAVLEELKKDPTTAGIPFIFITAHSEESKITQSRELGASGYLVKPFTLSELLNSIKKNLMTQEI